MFLNRNIIKARSLDEAVELIENKGFGVAYGFTVNIADVRNPKDMWSIEVCLHLGLGIDTNTYYQFV